MSIPLLDLDLASVHLYLSVVDLGSISKAATRHGLSQPSASQRLRKLERQLGVTLLDRSTSGSSLTPIGLELSRSCRALVGAAGEVANEALQRRQTDRLHTTVATVASATRHLLPSICSQLATGDPPLSVDIVAAEVVDACNLVRQAEADLAIVDGPVAPLSLQSTVIDERELIVVVGRTHPWASRTRAITGHALTSARIVLPERGSGTRDVIEDALAQRGHPLPSIGNIDVTSVDARRCLVAASHDVVSVIDRADVAEDLAKGNLHQVRCQVTFSQPIRIAWSGRKPRSEGAQQFTDVALAHRSTS